MSALALAVLVQQGAAIETILEYSCRDRNLLGMQSDLLGAHAMGVHNLVLVTGDVRPVGDYPDATAVFDVDAVGLTNVVSRLNHGLDIGGQSLGGGTCFYVGVQVNPTADDLEAELRRFEHKVQAGAEFVLTRPIFDLAAFERVLPRLAEAGLPIVAGLWAFDSLLNAEYLANEVPGVRVPDSLLHRMRQTPDGGAAAAEGVAIAHELCLALRERVQGVHVAMPTGRSDAALAVLEGVL
jgi:homocysteine S-methyltransferase